jgi:ribosomal protein S18 acetylase RimI-like enzyme
MQQRPTLRPPAPRDSPPASRRDTPPAPPRPATARDFPRLAACLARAFETDPVLRWLIPGAADRRRRAPRFYAAVLNHLAPAATILTTDGHAGVALWLAPRSPRPGWSAEVRYGLRMLANLRGRALHGLRLVGEIEAAHPRTRHWYLSLLGIEPLCQGRGLGSLLMQPVLQRCDREGLPAYLESSKEENIAFYRRHGFAVVGEVRVAGGPTLWPMLRPPLR